MQLHTVDLDGPVHYADFGGEGRPYVLVHGLGGSHLNWAAIAPLLARRGRVLAVDLPGFGLSPPGRRGISVATIQRTLVRFVRDVAGVPVNLFGNSMGGLLSMLVAAEHPELVRRLVLVGPSQPLPRRLDLDPTTVATFAAYATPVLGELLVAKAGTKLGPSGIVRYMFDYCCADPNRLAPEIVEQHVALAERRAREMHWDATAFVRTARSLVKMIVLQPRLIRQAADRITAPTLIVHGRHDRLVPVSASQALARRRPDFRLEVLEDCGHVPQLEDPQRVVDLYSRWADGETLRAAG